MIPSDLIIADIGHGEYQEVLDLQRSLNRARNDGSIPDVLIAVSHPHVYTMGIHRNPAEILDPNLKVFQVERGGSATYHGPGQIVIYFIINLRDRKMNIRDLIIIIEEAVSDTLEHYGISSEGRLHGETGVWVENRKICSVGLAINGFSTLHGIALNVNTDMARFGAIMPCGMTSDIMTSMEREAGIARDEDEVRGILLGNLEKSLRSRKTLKLNKIEGLREILMGNGL
jgi:lipoyl(octanoyl) transferase